MTKIHVGQICQVFRRLASHGSWDVARDALQKTYSLSNEDAIRILTGECMISKVHDNIVLLPDELHLDPLWNASQYAFYITNKYLYDGIVYEPYCRVRALTHKDLNIIKDRGAAKPYVDNEAQLHELNMLRARTYCDDEEKDSVVYDIKSGTWILSRPVYDEVYKYIPSQLLDYFDEFDFSGVIVPVVNAQPVADVESIVEQRKEFEANKQAIKKQADLHGGWITLTDTSNGKEYTIPKNAWLVWVLGAHDAERHNITWEPINNSGLKTPDDNPIHTDWWSFTGYRLTDAYDVKCNRFFYEQAAMTYFLMTKREVKVLTNINKFKSITAQVVHCKSMADYDKVDCDKKQIVVIPSASPEFEPIVYACAKVGSVVVTEIGGKLCHLAKVAREYGACIVMIDDAMRRIPELPLFKLDIDN